MKRQKRDILVVVKNQFLTEQAIEQEVEHLNEILRLDETDEQFCLAHEMVDRNRITQNSRIIIKATVSRQLPAFRFLINKN